MVSYNFLKRLYETSENVLVISDTEEIDQLKQEIYQLKEQLLKKDKTLLQLKDQSTEKTKPFINSRISFLNSVIC